jgi:NHL repeat
MPSHEGTVKVTAEIGILYDDSTEQNEYQRPYYVKPLGDHFITFLRLPHLTSIGWLSPSNGYVRTITDIECCHLKAATTIDCDETGSIYILSELKRQVSVIDNQGLLQRVYDLDIEGSPISIRCHKEGYFLVGTWRPGGVFLIDRHGRVVWKLLQGCGVLNEVRSAFRTPLNHFYIADTGLHHIIVVDLDGNIIKKFGPTGLARPGPDRLSHPSMIEPSQNSAFLVCDTRNHRVIKIDQSGTLLWQWPPRRERGDSWTQLFMPWCARELGNGELIIADTYNFRILRLSREREVLQVFGTTPVKRRILSFPRSVQPLPNGRYLVADTYNDRVVELDHHSRIHWQFNRGAGKSSRYELFWPRCALRLNNGTTLIADGRNNRVLFVDIKKHVEKVISGVSVGSLLTPLSDPHDVVQSPNGNLIIVDTGNNRILEITPDASCASAYPHPLGVDTDLSLSDPHHMSFGPQHRWVISDTGNNRIVIFNPASRDVTEIRELRFVGEQGFLKLKEPRACYYWHGNYWILDSGNSRLIITDKEFQVIWNWATVLESSPLRYISFPRWISLLSPNSFALSDYFNSRIVLLSLNLEGGNLDPDTLNHNHIAH